jgi:hypothetical protein
MDLGIYLTAYTGGYSAVGLDNGSKSYETVGPVCNILYYNEEEEEKWGIKVKAYEYYDYNYDTIYYIRVQQFHMILTHYLNLLHYIHLYMRLNKYLNPLFFAHILLLFLVFLIHNLFWLELLCLEMVFFRIQGENSSNFHRLVNRTCVLGFILHVFTLFNGDA